MSAAAVESAGRRSAKRNRCLTPIFAPTFTPCLAMNFFEHQQQARANSRRLTVLFVLAVLATVVAVNLVLAGLYLQIAAPAGMWLQHRWGALPNGFFVSTTLVVLLLIGGGSWLEMSRLAGGGA